MILPLVFTLAAHAAIFGSDLRTNVNQSSPFAPEGRAVAVAVLSANIAPSATVMGTYKLDTSSLSDLVCSEEKFSKDPSLSYACSGFLVAPDLMVTAGHCMVNFGESINEPEMYCSAYGWLFDYQTDTGGKTQLDAIPADNYYKCKRVVYAIREETFPFRDYALVQLERPVTGRKPFVIADKAVTKGDGLTMIGFPFGQPMKVSPSGQVTVNDPTRQSFLTTLSAFEGNSGSVVYNDKKEAVGILVAGTPSANLVDSVGKKCQTYNKCDLSGKNCTQSDTDADIKGLPGYQGVGSEVQRIAPIAELIKNLK
jgi:V8-like Glu-specific endopeptidase